MVTIRGKTHLSGWNFADIWEVVAEQLPGAPAQIQGARRLSWADVDRRADGVAQALLDAGVAEQDKVAQYLYNCPEYLESMFAAFKAGLAPVNTNYRTSSTAKFTLGDDTKVITDDGREVQPGSGETGRVAVGGWQPVGYYKDEAKTATTFLTFEGRRYSVPGDYAQVEADGSLTLLGRGSVCINTGGEKVYPEEVEEVLKTLEAVNDAVAVGIPDEKLGEAITAVVELVPGSDLDEGAIIAHVKSKLAAYKAPKRVLPIGTIGRAPNGKVDYQGLKTWAADQLGVAL